MGAVWLVGTGPGDPELLTLKAARLLAAADVVLYDRLVSPEVLSLAGPSALCVYVGKQAGYHTRSQGEIHSLLLTFAQQGATVVRLKGGDPFIFGRGGEEAAALRARGVRVGVVPGVTAAAGIAAELRLPLTHRGEALGVRFLTAHAAAAGIGDAREPPAGSEAAASGNRGEMHASGGGSDPIFPPHGADELAEAAATAAADRHTTLVVYMGLGTLPALRDALLAGGLPASTPAVAV